MNNGVEATIDGRCTAVAGAAPARAPRWAAARRWLVLGSLSAALLPVSAARTDPAPLPAWAKPSPEQVAEAARLNVPVAYEEPTTGIRFVLIPGGTFVMGSPESEQGRHADEGPPHRVTLPAFYLSVHEVTNGQYRRKEARHRSTTDGDAHPVTDVDWDQATAYAAWLDARGREKGYALPTEAQWEHACRAGTATRWSFGDEEARSGDHAWSRENSMFRPHPVGEKPPNGWGLFDMHGNVAEWCADDAHDSYSGAPADGRAWVDDPRASQRVLRGGSQNDPALYLRSASRGAFSPTFRNSDLGFRLARAVPVLATETPSWAKVSPEQVAEAARRKVPVAYEEPTTGIRFVLIPGGAFLMGSPEGEQGRDADEGPQHRVTLPAYYLAVHEVTNGQYRRKEAGHRSTTDGDTHPVTDVDWGQATAYAAWLNGRGTEKGYGLPTEAQWEHACRAGTTTRWSFGDDDARLGEHAWFGANSGRRAHPVGEKTPNRWGLYDMYGNVWEWCADDSHATYAGAPMDGSAWVDSPRAARRVLRGGSWFYSAQGVRSADRGGLGPSASADFLGFRLARAVTAP